MFLILIDLSNIRNDDLELNSFYIDQDYSVYLHKIVLDKSKIFVINLFLENPSRQQQ